MTCADLVHLDRAISGSDGDELVRKVENAGDCRAGLYRDLFVKFETHLFLVVFKLHESAQSVSAHLAPSLG